MTDGRPILVVSHAAGRSGAPMVLLRFLQWLRTTTDIELSILLLRGGDLAADFAELGPTEVLEAGPSGPHPRLQLIRHGIRAKGPEAASRALDQVRVRRSLRKLGWTSPDTRPAAVWLNSVASLRVLDALPGPPPVVSLYAHELEGVLSATFPDGSATRRLAACDHVVGASPGIVANLARRHGVRPEQLRIATPFIDEATDAVDEAEIRRRLDIGPDAPLVGAVGQSGWRKGVDLFVVLAKLLARDERAADAHLVWVGGDDGDPAGLDARADVRAAGLEGRVHFVGEQPNGAGWVRACAVAVAPSREDPFPLAVLEAGLASRPVVAFGGPDQNADLADLLADGCGLAIPRLDVPALAEAVGGLLSDPARREALGAALHARVVGEHVTPVAAPRLLDALRGLPR